MAASFLDVIFDDKRLSISILICWLVIVLLAFKSIGLFTTDFMRFGPSETTKIMTLTINSWHEWWMVACASFLSTCINDFFSDSLGPFFINTIQDHKTRYLPYSKTTCYIILQLWSTYCCLMSIFSIGLLMSQIDFLLIRLLADLIVNSFTTFKFLKFKEYNRRLYYNEHNGHPTTGSESTDATNSDAMQRAAEELSDILSDQEDRPLTGGTSGSSSG
jgi:hypothetical protein